MGANPPIPIVRPPTATILPPALTRYQYIEEGEGQLANVKAAPYGAAGDGVTNDTVAFQAAFDSGREVYIPAGTYLVGRLTVSTNGQTIRGAGKATILKYTGAFSGDVINVAASRVTLTDFAINGDKAAASGSGRGAIDVNTADTAGVGTGTLIENVYIYDSDTYGIRIVGASQVTVRGCRFSECDLYAIFAICVGQGASDLLIDGNSISTATETYGIVVHGDNVGTFTWVRTRIIGNTIVLPALPSVDCIGIEVWGYCPGSVIDGNTTYGGRFGISANVSDYTVIADNVVTAAATWGIEVASSSYVTVSGNTVNGAASTDNGIAWDGTSLEGTCTGNTITGTTSKAVWFFQCARVNCSGNVIKSPSNGIYIQTGTDAVVCGNYIDLAGGGNNGIVLDGPAAVSIVGNVIHGHAFAAVNLISTTTAFSGSVTGNEMTSPRVLNSTSGSGSLGTLSASGNSPFAIPTVASAATITAPVEADSFIVSGTTTITSVTASYPGRVIRLTFSGALTFTDGSNLKLAGNFVTTADDTITLVSDGTNWTELGRSVN